MFCIFLLVITELGLPVNSMSMVKYALFFFFLLLIHTSVQKFQSHTFYYLYSKRIILPEMYPSQIVWIYFCVEVSNTTIMNCFVIKIEIRTEKISVLEVV